MQCEAMCADFLYSMLDIVRVLAGLLATATSATSPAALVS